MNDHLIELYVARGRLRERISMQRNQLAQDLAPLVGGLELLDKGRSVAQQVRSWMTRHPAIVSTLLVAVLVWRPRIVLRSVRWGYGAWRKWTTLRDWMRTR